MKFTLPLLITLSLISCSRKSDLKPVIPFDDSSKVASTEKIEAASISKHSSFYGFPILKLHGVESEFSILGSNGEVVRKVPVKIEERSFIRKKLLDILENPYSQKLSIEDLVTHEYFVSPSEVLKVINHHSFGELSNLRLQTNSKLLLESSKEGMIESLDYEAEISEVESNRVPFTLRNSSEQTDGFEFGVKPKESYSFLTGEASVEETLKKVLSGSGIRYHLSNFELEERSLEDWKSRVLSEGSVLIISREEGEEYSFIQRGESVEEALVREGKTFDLNSDFRMINFLKMNEEVSEGQILALFVMGGDKNKVKGQISESKNIKEFSFTKKKNKDVHFFIQLSGRSHTIKHWYESQVVIFTETGAYGTFRSSRSCNVSRRKVVSSATTLDIAKEKWSYTLFYGGRSISLESLVKEKKAKVEGLGRTQKITLFDLPGSGDFADVRFVLNSEMKEVDIVQDKGQCVLLYSRSQMHGGEDPDWIRIREEKFQNFQESSYKDFIGTEKMMDLIIVN